MPKCLKTLDITIANFYEETIDGEKVILVNQLVRKHITKWGAGSVGYNSYNQL
jgi:hypothetical protein